MIPILLKYQIESTFSIIVKVSGFIHLSLGKNKIYYYYLLFVGK